MKTGVMVQDLHASQLAAYLIDSSNKMIEASHHENTVLFVDDICSSNCIKASCPIMQTIDVFSYDGIVIATDLYTARKLIKAPGPTRKFFYLWDLEWFRQQYPYNFLRFIYRNPELEIIVRSEDHAMIFEDLWNRKPVAIVKNANMSELIGVVNGRT